MTVYLIALAPLLLAVTAVVVALPMGLHYADKERAEREFRAKAEAVQPAYGTHPFHMRGLVYNPIYTEVSIIGGNPGGQPQLLKPFLMSPAEQKTSQQPSGKLAEAA